MKDLKYIEDFQEIKKKLRMDGMDFVIHLIPEMLGVDKTLEIISTLNKLGYHDFLFLGYKTNGRGANCQHKTLTEKEVDDLFGHHSYIRIDTTFANRYYDMIKNRFSVDRTITLNEGEYSMYIDGVTSTAYKSSYQLDKPYPIGHWPVTVEKVFASIRKDGGFKTYEEYEEEKEGEQQTT